MKNWVLITYVTKDTPYEEVLETYLRASLSKLNLQLTTVFGVLPNLGSWQLNTGQKSKFIFDCMNELKDSFDAVVFLDADATIEKEPVLFNNIPEEYDIAAYTLDQNKWYQNGSNIKELLTGTLYIRINSKTLKMVEDWSKEVNKSNEWEQKVLDTILKKHKDVKLYDLPVEYCYIKTLPGGLEPIVKVKEPVIVHHQVSRQLKKWLKLQKYGIKGISNAKPI